MSTELSRSWERDDWARAADALLRSLMSRATEGHARFNFPEPEGPLGAAVDSLEAFARSFLLAGFRLAGEGGEDPNSLAEWYARGLVEGTSPGSPDRWPRPDEHGQAKVEAASLALILDLTRPWIWDRLSSAEQRNVVDYLSPVVGDDTYPRINWVWFRLVVQTFLRSVDGPHSLAEMRADLAAHDSFARADGWLADGDTRAYDHYTGWALHLYPTLWSRMLGAADLAADRAAADRAALSRYLQDAVRLVGADGSPLIQGRSLVYRFAAAAPFWVGAIAEVDTVPLGQLRRAAGLIVQHFHDRGVPGRDGLLDLGWFEAWPSLAQSYSGPGSPYWAAKGMLGLALPADHPAWTEAEVPLPSETEDSVVALRAPGWLASTTASDGIVRIVNHGTDHARAGEAGGDSPLYARLGYSTATFPLLDDSSWTSPLDNAVVLLDADENATHRSGMETLAVAADGRSGTAASQGRVHWLAADEVQQHHGYGRTGRTTVAGHLEVVSLAHGAWEVRLARAGALHPDVTALRMGGWPTTGGLSSRITPLTPCTATGREDHDDAGPLGSASTPWATFPAAPDAWHAAWLELATHPTEGSVALRLGETSATATVTWPDGLVTTHPLSFARTDTGSGAETTADPMPDRQYPEGETR